MVVREHDLRSHLHQLDTTEDGSSLVTYVS